jgi:hypothetical protein
MTTWTYRPEHPEADEFGFVLKEKLYARPESRTYVISDDLGAMLEHHGYSDGRKTDSKSKFREWTRAAGLVEKGNDRDRTPRRQGDSLKEVIRDVAYATEMVKNGYVPQMRRMTFDE